MDIKEKLTAELTNAKLGKHETAVKNAVMKTICKFCEQNAEFKQAIEQSDKSFADCLKSSVAGVKEHISDLDCIHLKNIQREFNEALELVSNASENERSSYIKAFRAALNACGDLIAKL